MRICHTVHLRKVSTNFWEKFLEIFKKIKNVLYVWLFWLNQHSFNCFFRSTKNLQMLLVITNGSQKKAKIGYRRIVMPQNWKIRNLDAVSIMENFQILLLMLLEYMHNLIPIQLFWILVLDWVVFLFSWAIILEWRHLVLNKIPKDVICPKIMEKSLEQLVIQIFVVSLFRYILIGELGWKN